MKPEYELISFHIIEKFNNNLLMTWTYPSITDALKQNLTSNCLKTQRCDFIYYRVEKYWIYIWERYKEQKIYAFALITKSYNPDKYRDFGSHLCNIYEISYKPIELVKVFLGAFTNGSYKIKQNGTQYNIYLQEFNEVEINYQALIDLFDIEIILIYNALLLKKRIFVYHANFTYLLKHLEMMTQLLDPKFRNPNEYLFPFVRNINSDVKGRTFFLAGLIDKNINIKPDSFDLFVNLQNSTINISTKSKDIFQMTKWHKEIALLLTHQDETKLAEKTSVLHKRTLDLLTNLQSFASISPNNEGNGMVTLEILRSKKLPPAMENFLFNLAVAENIMML